MAVEWATELAHCFPNLEIVVVEQRSECVGAMPPRCRRYVENAMQRLGIRTIYGAKYTEFLGDGGRLPSNDKFLWHAHGIKKPARVYMAVGVRAVNEFLPARTLTEKHNGKGGWIVCNRKLQIVLDSNLGHPGGSWYTTPHAPRPGPGYEKPRNIKE